MAIFIKNLILEIEQLKEKLLLFVSSARIEQSLGEVNLTEVNKVARILALEENIVSGLVERLRS